MNIRNMYRQCSHEDVINARLYVKSSDDQFPLYKTSYRSYVCMLIYLQLVTDVAITLQ
jgi:hypothetical protein